MRPNPVNNHVHAPAVLHHGNLLILDTGSTATQDLTAAGMPAGTGCLVGNADIQYLHVDGPQVRYALEPGTLDRCQT
jgi:hypothetical protein